MIIASGDLGVSIDLGNDEPGMTLQLLDKSGWHDYLVDGEQAKSPVDIESLASWKYRLTTNKRNEMV